MSEGRDKPEVGGIAGKLFRGRLARMSGVEGSSIGIVLVAFTGLGAFIGWLLDAHFHTSYWLPILAMVGVAAGFRDMLATARRMSQQESQRRSEKASARNSSVRSQDSEPSINVEPEVAGRSQTRIPPPPEPGSARSSNDGKPKP